jgi:methyl-accepting chemotaxis protein
MRRLALLRDMRIGGRLGAGFAVLIVLMLALIAVGVGRIQAVLDNTELILHDRYAKVALAHTIENEVNRQARQQAARLTDLVGTFKLA